MRVRRKSGDRLKRLRCATCANTFAGRQSLLHHLVHTHGTLRHRFSCTNCDLTYFYKRELTNHQRSRHRDETLVFKPFSCARCRSRFDKVGALKNHIMSDHVLARSYGCSRCSALFATAVQMHDHLASKHVSHVEWSMPYCYTCSKCFKARMILAQHLKRAHGILTAKMAKFERENPTPKPLFICSTCLNVAKTKEKLTHHFSSHVTSAVFTCHICPSAFMKYYKLVTHVADHSKRGWIKQRQSYMCVHCCATYSNKERLTKHMPQHIHVRAFACDVCHASFKTSINLSKHHHRAHFLPERKFKCNVCPSAYSQPHHLRRHHRKVHENAAKRFKCMDCPVAFLFKTELTRHALRKHSTARQYRCAVCVAQFKTSAELLRQLSVHSDDKPHKCDFCSKSFKSKSNRQMHERNVHLQKHRPFQCNKCPFAFKTVDSLRRHENVHCEERSYGCTDCTTMFKSQPDLLRHVRQVHDATAGKKFCCPQCTSSFKTISDLKRHQRSHSAERHFKCPHCEVAFKDGNTRTLHLRTHVEIYGAPFKCGVCSKAFTGKPGLKSHLVSHSNARPFKCQQCGAKFKCSTSLKKHNVAHAAERSFACDLCPSTFGRLPDMKRHRLVHFANAPFACARCTASYKRAQWLKEHMRVHRNLILRAGIAQKK